MKLDEALEALKDLDEAGPFPCRGEFVLPEALDEAVTAYMEASGISVRSRAMRKLVKAGVLVEGRKLLRTATTA